MSLLFMCTPGCGGGTISTEPSQISGRVVDKSGAPLAEVKITDVVSGDSTVSDKTGEFILASEESAETLNLLIEYGNLEKIVELERPARDIPFEVSIKIDSKSGIISAVIITDIDVGPTPNPSETPKEAIQSFMGKAVSSNGKPAQGAKVTLLYNGAQSKSDSTGRFSLSSRGLEGTARFQVAYKNHRGSFSISDIPRDQDITVRFTLELRLELSQPSDPTQPPVTRLKIVVRKQT